LYNADVLRAQLGPAEQPVLLTHWDNPQGAFEVIRVDRYLWIIQVDQQASPALTDVCQRAKGGTARQESLLVELAVDPGKKRSRTVSIALAGVRA
jgi:hypothetical protein